MEQILHRLTDDIYYMSASEETDRPIMALIVGETRSLVVDAGNSEQHAQLFLHALNQQGLVRPHYLAITHWHWDHVFGIKTMGIPTFAHAETKRQVEEMMTLDWSDQALDQRVAQGQEILFCSEKIKAELPIRDHLELAAPDIGFVNRVEVDLGGIHCIIEHVGGDHSNDSSIIYVPERKVLFLGDCLCPDLYSGQWSYSLEKMLPLLEKLQSYDAEFYVESHSVPVDKEMMMQEFKELASIGRLVGRYQTDVPAMIRELEATEQRSLTEDELSVIQFYRNGLEKRDESDHF